MKCSILTVASTAILLTCYAAAGVMSAYPLVMGPLLILFLGIIAGALLMYVAYVQEENEKAPDERQLNQGHRKNIKLDQTTFEV